MSQGTGAFQKQKEGGCHLHRDGEWLREPWRNVGQAMCGAAVLEN